MVRLFSQRVLISVVAVLRTSAIQQHHRLSEGQHHNSDSNASAVSLTDMFLFAGQSNSVGLGLVSELKGTIPKNMLAFPLSYAYEEQPTEGWTNYAVREEKDDLYFGNFEVGKFGSEISFAQKLASSLYGNENFGIVKSAESGSGLEDKWLNGNLLDALLVRAKAAKDAPECNGGHCSIKALIWAQGEADSGDAEWAKDYKMNLKTMVTRIRKELGVPSLFVMIVELPKVGTVSTYVGADIVRQAQNDFVNEQGPKLAAMISTDNVGTYPHESELGDLHYSTDGLALIGERLASAYTSYAKMSL